MTIVNFSFEDDFVTNKLGDQARNPSGSSQYSVPKPILKPYSKTRNSSTYAPEIKGTPRPSDPGGALNPLIKFSDNQRSSGVTWQGWWCASKGEKEENVRCSGDVDQRNS